MDKKVLEVMLDKKTTLLQLKKFLKERKLKPLNKNKNGIIEFLVNTQLKESDLRILQDMAFGPRIEKGFAAYICYFDADIIREDLEKKVKEVSRFTNANSNFKINLLEASNLLEILCEFTEEELMKDAFTNEPTFGSEIICVTVSFNFDQKSVVLYSGNYDISTKVATYLNSLLGINIKPLTVYKTYAVDTVSFDEDPLSVQVLDFIVNRISSVGLIEKFEGIDFEPTDSENITSIKHKGDSVLSDPETCRLICNGYRIVGFRVYFRYLNEEDKVVFTHVSITFKDRGTKISVARGNYKEEAIAELFNKIKDQYIEMFFQGAKDMNQTEKLVIKIRERAKEVS